jgi:putative methyltransferase (TIGR04325 family)
MQIKFIIKKIIPPIIIDIIKLIYHRKYGWFGDFKSWEEAQKLSTGYDAPEIITKVKESTLKVKKGEAVYERDGVIFDKIQYSWPLLAGLMYAAAKSEGKLSVLDFGGSLGTTFFQNKKFLDGLKNVVWCIVEQKHFVDTGKAYFENDKLKFYYDVESCIKEQNPNILILSSVLQYLKEPYQFLDYILKSNFTFVIVDRTPFSFKEQIKLQIVPPWIYKARYPCWFFEEKKFLTFFKRHGFTIIEEFEALDGKTRDYWFKGFILEKKNDKQN